MTQPSSSRSANEDCRTIFVTFMVADHFFGIPVMNVQDILTPETIARVPLGPPEVRGLINLRGRIVTVIDMRTRLSLPAQRRAENLGKCVTVEKDGEFYALLVDRVGDVVTLEDGAREANPATLDPLWLDLSNGIFRAGDRLLVSLDLEHLLNIRGRAEVQ